MTEKGTEYEAVNYFNQPLSAESLKKLLRSAGLKPSQAVRTKEATYKKLVEGKELSGEQLIRIMAEHPELIQRPIVVKGSKAVLARPIENLKKLKIGSVFIGARILRRRVRTF